MVKLKSPYELNIALSKRKTLYEKEHPETVHGVMGKGETKEKFLKKIEVTTTVTSTDKPPVVRFTESAAKILGVSEATVQDRVRVGEAILRGDVFTEEEVELFKKGAKSHTKLVKKLRKERKTKKKTPYKPKHKLKIPKGDLLKWCRVCNDSAVLSCPECGKQVLLCDDVQQILLKTDKQACDRYSETN